MTLTAYAASGAAGSAGLSAVWEPDDSYDLARTLSVLQRGRMDPSACIDDGVAWLSLRTSNGPATLRLTQAPNTGCRSAGGVPISGGVHATAWGAGARGALDDVPALLGAGDDWSGFDDPDFQATLPPRIRQARRRHPGLRLPSTGRMIDALVPVILEQKITTIEARRAWRYLVGKHGDHAPGPAPKHLRMIPSAEQWRRIPVWDWHRAGVDAKRSATIVRACAAAGSLERLSTMSTGEELTAKLCSIPGIGPWTAAEVTQRTHGCPDSVSVGDFHLPAYIGWALAGKPVDDAGMLELLEPWRGHRQRVVRMLVLSGFRKPSFGPRLAPADHRFR